MDWSFFRQRTVQVAIAAVLAILLLIVVVSRYNGTRNALIDKATTLNAQYLDNQNELTAFLNKAHETFSIAGAKTAAVDKVLTDAVKGRYSEGSTARPTGGQFISALREAYPDLAALNVFDRVQTVVEAGREAYKQKQTKLLDLLRSYDRYRNRGILHSKVVSLLGYPQLEARIGNRVTRGSAARDQMYAIVLSSESKEAFKTGEQGPINFGPTTTG